MATLNNGGSGKRQTGQHDGQKNYQHSNQRNPDNVRSNPRDHEYKDYDSELTNDANFESGEPQVNLDMDDQQQNVEK